LVPRFADADDEAGADDEGDDGAGSEVCRIVPGEPVECDPPLDEDSSCVASFSCVDEEEDDESWPLEPDDE
jgi:hypothetical protein